MRAVLCLKGPKRWSIRSLCVLDCCVSYVCVFCLSQFLCVMVGRAVVRLGASRLQVVVEGRSDGIDRNQQRSKMKNKNKKQKKGNEETIETKKLN